MADTIAVMDEVGIDRAVLGGVCIERLARLPGGARTRSGSRASSRSGRTCPTLTPPLPHRRRAVARSTRSCDDRRGLGEGRTGTTGDATGADFAEFFFDQMLPEPHSTKQCEDAVGWALQARPATR